MVRCWAVAGQDGRAHGLSGAGEVVVARDAGRECGRCIVIEDEASGRRIAKVHDHTAWPASNSENRSTDRHGKAVGSRPRSSPAGRRAAPGGKKPPGADDDHRGRALKLRSVPPSLLCPGREDGPIGLPAPAACHRTRPVGPITSPYSWYGARRAGSPTYHWKLKKRSLAAFHAQRYAFGSTVRVGRPCR